MCCGDFPVFFGMLKVFFGGFSSIVCLGSDSLVSGLQIVWFPLMRQGTHPVPPPSSPGPNLGVDAIFEILTHVPLPFVTTVE